MVAKANLFALVPNAELRLFYTQKEKELVEVIWSSYVPQAEYIQNQHPH